MNENFRILIAYGVSDCADNAVDELARAGLPRNAQVLIIYVRGKWLPVASLIKGNTRLRDIPYCAWKIHQLL